MLPLVLQSATLTSNVLWIGICHKYSANTANKQIYITGWKQVYSNSGLTIHKNETGLTKLIIKVSMTYNSLSWSIIRSFPAEYLPEAMLYSDTNQGNVRFRIASYAINNNGAVQYISTSSYTGELSTLFIY